MERVKQALFPDANPEKIKASKDALLACAIIYVAVMIVFISATLGTFVPVEEVISWGLIISHLALALLVSAMYYIWGKHPEWEEEE